MAEATGRFAPNAVPNEEKKRNEMSIGDVKYGSGLVDIPVLARSSTTGYTNSSLILANESSGEMTDYLITHG